MLSGAPVSFHASDRIASVLHDAPHTSDESAGRWPKRADAGAAPELAIAGWGGPMTRTSRKMRITVLATTLVLLLSGLVSYVALRTAAAATLAIADTEDTLLSLERVLSVARDAETGQRGFLLTGDVRYLEPYYAAIASLSDRVVKLRSKLSADPADRGEIDALQSLIKAKTDELAHTIDLYQGGGHAAALAVVESGQGKRIMELIRARIAQLQVVQTRLLASQLDTESSARLWTSVSIIGVWALALILVLLLLQVVQRDNERVRLSEERLATTLRSIGDAVIATDAQGQVRMLNPVAEELTGWPMAQALDVPLEQIFRIVNEESRATVENPVARVLREGSVVGLANHTLLIGRDGKETPIEDSAAPIRTSNGSIDGVVLVFHDASLERSAELSLREADRKKDEFIAMLAHELRNPLAPIMQAAQMLQVPGATPEQLRWGHQVIDRQAKTMRRLLDDLLDVSRITRGTLEIRKSSVLLATLVDGAVETTQPTIGARHHALELDLPSEPIQLDADPVRLTQVIANLLLNAAKYTDPGGRIRLTAKRAGSELFLTVADDGIGLAADALSGLFDMFVQVKEAQDRHAGGLGIGLALARRLVELHGGTIDVRSAGIGRGSEFTIRMPCRVQAAGSVAPAAAVAQLNPAVLSLRIVIADDNRDAAESLAMLLQMDGHQVSVAHDGAAALNIVHAIRPQVAVLDIGMPGLNGYEVAQRIRSTLESESIVLVALTGWGQAQDLERAKAAGFDYHLVKPADPSQLRSLIMKISAGA
jgi:PAS domain S-box-containing protein